MDEHFDPYHKWLGIPPKDQPPTHYRLLGIEQLESDPDVIENAADQRMRHVRSLQHGQHQAQSQQLLNEISNAKICLLDPDQKAAYDQQFTPKVPTISTSGEKRTGSRPAASSKRAKNPAVELVKIVLGGLGGIVISFLLLSFLREDWDMLGIAKAVRGTGATSSGAAPANINPVKPPDTPVLPPPPPIKPEKSSGQRKVDTPVKLTALEGAVEYQKFDWSKGLPPVDLGPTSESFVVLSGFSGHYLGNGEWVRINVKDGRYTLTGGGVQGVAANATRVRTPYRKWFEDEVEMFTWKKSQSKVKLIHQNDGFAVLCGAQGCFLGANNAVKLEIDPADGCWYLDGQTNFDTQGSALVYRFKQPGNFRPEVELTDWKPGDPKQSPLPIAEGLCGIASISGAFKGYGENINTAAEDDGRWHTWVVKHQASTRGGFLTVRFATPDLLALSPNKPNLQIAKAVTPIPTPEPVLQPMPEPVKPKTKSPPPDAAAIAAAEKTVESLVAKDDVEALLTAAAGERPAAESYVLILAARDKASDQGDCNQAMRIVDTLAQGFEIDLFAVQTDTLLKLTRSCETPQSNQTLARLLLQHFDTAAQNKRTDSLESLAESALTASRKANEPDLVRRATLALIQSRKKSE